MAPAVNSDNMWMSTGVDAMKNTPDNSICTAAENAPTRRGMVLSFQPLSLVFNHVNYYVDMPAVSPISHLSLSILQNRFTVGRKWKKRETDSINSQYKRLIYPIDWSFIPFNHSS